MASQAPQASTDAATANVSQPTEALPAQTHEEVTEDDDLAVVSSQIGFSIIVTPNKVVLG